MLTFLIRTICPVPVFLSQMTCPKCPARYPVRGVLYRLSCPGCPVPVVLSQLSCPGCPVPVSCPGCPVPGVLYRVSCTGCPVPGVLSRVLCPECPVSGVLSRVSCPRCPVPGVLSIPVVLAFLSWLSCSCCLSGYHRLSNKTALRYCAKKMLRYEKPSVKPYFLTYFAIKRLWGPCNFFKTPQMARIWPIYLKPDQMLLNVFKNRGVVGIRLSQGNFDHPTFM
jgi:hypothetical protein